MIQHQHPVSIACVHLAYCYKFNVNSNRLHCVPKTNGPLQLCLGCMRRKLYPTGKWEIQLPEHLLSWPPILPLHITNMHSAESPPYHLGYRGVSPSLNEICFSLTWQTSHWYLSRMTVTVLVLNKMSQFYGSLEHKIFANFRLNTSKLA